MMRMIFSYMDSSLICKQIVLLMNLGTTASVSRRAGPRYPASVWDFMLHPEP